MLTRPITRGITRPITRPLVRQSSTFNPLTLFAQGQQGAWYDPSDLTTLFQDAAGTTPVTADGDPVGLMLDKSRELERGPELVTNGTFDADLSGWTSSTGSFQWGSGGVVGRSSTGITDEFYQSVNTAIGSFYVVEVEINNFTLNPEGYVDGLVPNTLENTGVNQFVFKATATSHNVGIIATGADIEFTRISVKELPGNHASQPTTAAKPTYRTDGTLRWLEFDGVDDQLVATIPGITNATVAIAKSTGTEITYPVDLSGGTFTMNETNYGIIVREGEFTAQEEANVIAYLNEKAGIS